jgi:fucose permease
LKIWGTRATAPFSVIHLGYSCGAIVANLIVRPFLNYNNSYVNTTESSQFNSTLSRSISIPLDVDIRVPYLIAAGLSFLIGVGHFIFLMQNHNNRREKAEKQQASIIFCISKF